MVLSTGSADDDASALDPLALWVLPVSNLAGVARHTLDALGAGIPGWRVVVLAPSGPIVGKLEEIGVPVVVGEFGPESGLLASMRTLRHTCAALRPEIVHTHLAYADIVAAVTPLSGAKRVSTEHGIAACDHVYQGSSWRSLAMRRVHQVRLKRADALIAVCQSTADTMRRNWHTDAEISVIVNGFDTPERIPERQPTSAPHVLSLSRLAREKRIDAVLKAFSLLLQEHPDARLTIAGEGELDQELRVLADDLGIADRTVFPGFIDPDVVLAEADVVVQLSVWENCSYTLLDAIGAGCGVVASPVGGNSEILPVRCLIDPTESQTVANAILTLATRLTERPSLASEWPSRADMSARLGEIYGDLTPDARPRNRRVVGHH
ncbi:MAG: glycosyltransferase [Allobranchiibius sp.]